MLTVHNHAWHYRIYNHWRENIARKERGTIDLCHYMRAILLFTPGYYIGITLLIIAVSLAYALAALFCLVTVPLWGPVWLVTHNRDWHKRGARRVGDAIGNGCVSAANWITDHGDRVMIALAGIVVISVFTVLTLDEWWLGIASFAAVAAGVAAAIGLIFGIIAFAEWYGPRRAAKRRAKRDKQMRDLMNQPPRPVKPPKPPKGPSWLSLMWQFVKAKKKRICPLIQVDERRTA